MADVSVKNYSSNNVTYENVPKIWLSSPDGPDDPTKLVPFTYGEAVSKTVEPDFSGGDMAVPIAEGELVTELTVAKPADLVPEKIAAGEYIAGVGPGTHEGGGGGDVDADAYAEYTYNDAGEIVAAKLHGFKSIRAYMFYRLSALESVDLTDSPEITSIGSYAFYDCDALKSFTFPANIASVDASAFTGTSFQNVHFPGTLAEWLSIPLIGSSLSKGTKLYVDGTLIDGDIVIPDGVTNIGNYAFYYQSGITGVHIPDSVTSIGTWAFGNTGLVSVTIPDSVTSIGSSAFRSCTSLKTLVIDSGVSMIGDYAFDGCTKLDDVTISEGVSRIGGSAFLNCSALTTITIPASIARIDTYAFSGCSKLTSAVFVDTDGWYRSTSSSATSGTAITVTNAATAARYLRNTYRTYYWFNG